MLTNLWSDLNGIIIVDKHPGCTSRQCVDMVMRIFNVPKAGHAGTLDPFASGVLPVCLNRATKIVEYIRSGSKKYRAHLRLGLVTDTQDIDGDIIREVRGSAPVDIEQLSDILQSFVGKTKQITPAFSARKSNGVRLYQLARNNLPIPRIEKTIQIHQITLHEYCHPDVVFDVSCSEGTYIRMLGSDIGDRLGMGGTLVELRRLEVGNITEDQSVTLEKLARESELGVAGQYIMPMEKALSGVPAAVIRSESTAKFYHGQQMVESDFSVLPVGFEHHLHFCVFSESGRFLGIGEKGISDAFGKTTLKTARLIDISNTGRSNTLPDAHL